MRALMKSCLVAGMALLGTYRLVLRQTIEFWHAMSGVLEERVNEIVGQVQQVAERVRPSVPSDKGSYDEVINGTIAAYRASRQPQRSCR